ncbi:E3 ubiquitin-protein ligase BRE1 [Dictyocoela muelleri]|nr:E3 ubiquitin-protein ligase BRE1 [Dictyocoela muelleri]
MKKQKIDEKFKAIIQAANTLIDQKFSKLIRKNLFKEMKSYKNKYQNLLNSQNVDNKDKKINELENEIEKLKNELNDKDKSINISDNNRINNKPINNNDNKNTINIKILEDLHEENKKLKEKYQKLKEEYQKINDNNKNDNDNNDNNNDNNNKNDNKITDKNDNNNNTVFDYDQFINSLSVNINSEIKNLEKINAEQINENTKMKSYYKKLMFKLENEIEERRSEIERIKEANEKMKIKVESEIDSLKKYEREVEKFYLIFKNNDDKIISNEEIINDYQLLLEKYKLIQKKNFDLESKLKMLEVDDDLCKKEREILREKEIKFKIRENELKKKISEIDEKYHERVYAATFHKRNFMRIKAEHEIYQNEIEKIKNEKNLLKNKINDDNKKNEKLKLEIQSIKDDLTFYKDLSEKLMNNENIFDLNDINKYRRLLICSICDINYKDTALSKCMHLFCKDCVENRIKMRNRKCPICAETFNFNDIKRVYL